eukprot:gene18215-biopygen5292
MKSCHDEGVRDRNRAGIEATDPKNRRNKVNMKFGWDRHYVRKTKGHLKVWNGWGTVLCPRFGQVRKEDTVIVKSIKQQAGLDANLLLHGTGREIIMLIAMARTTSNSSTQNPREPSSMKRSPRAPRAEQTQVRLQQKQSPDPNDLLRRWRWMPNMDTLPSLLRNQLSLRILLKSPGYPGAEAEGSGGGGGLGCEQ